MKSHYIFLLVNDVLALQLPFVVGELRGELGTDDLVRRSALSHIYSRPEFGSPRDWRLLRVGIIEDGRNEPFMPPVEINLCEE